MDVELLQKSIEYAFMTILGGLLGIFVLAILYEKIVIEENSTWRFWISFILVVIVITAIYYILFYEGIL